MITLEEFVNKYNGKKVDADGCFGAQCVDLFRQSDFGAKIPVVALDRLSVDCDFGLRIGNTFHGDFQIVFGFGAVMTVQHGAVSQIGDFQHVFFSFSV